MVADRRGRHGVRRTVADRRGRQGVRRTVAERGGRQGVRGTVSDQRGRCPAAVVERLGGLHVLGRGCLFRGRHGADDGEQGQAHDLKVTKVKLNSVTYAYTILSSGSRENSDR